MADVSTTLDLADRTREADDPHSLVVRFSANKPLHLDAGVDFGPLFAPSVGRRRRKGLVGALKGVLQDAHIKSSKMKDLLSITC